MLGDGSGAISHGLEDERQVDRIAIEVPADAVFSGDGHGEGSGIR